ncbi:hypothetical protein BU15DRAFT_69182 [Melanogaster broomeanus]|nr:hypothetical protein BU15DRAFT_69182 [Melanogaster broomeanus]
MPWEEGNHTPRPVDYGARVDSAIPEFELPKQGNTISDRHPSNAGSVSPFTEKISRDDDAPASLHLPIPAHVLSRDSELLRAHGFNSSHVPTSQRSTIDPGLLQERVLYQTDSYSWTVGQYPEYFDLPASSGLPFAGSSEVNALRETASRTPRKFRSNTHAPYSIHTAHSHSNVPAVPSRTEANSFQCGWRVTDSSICGELITRDTLPDHLVAHGIVDMAHDEPVTCRWCREGRKPMKRESIVRHIREIVYVKYHTKVVVISLNSITVLCHMLAIPTHFSIFIDSTAKDFGLDFKLVVPRCISWVWHLYDLCDGMQYYYVQQRQFWRVIICSPSSRSVFWPGSPAYSPLASHHRSLLYSFGEVAANERMPAGSGTVTLWPTRHGKPGHQPEHWYDSLVVNLNCTENLTKNIHNHSSGIWCQVICAHPRELVHMGVCVVQAPDATAGSGGGDQLQVSKFEHKRSVSGASPSPGTCAKSPYLLSSCYLT